MRPRIGPIVVGLLALGPCAAVVHDSRPAVTSQTPPPEMIQQMQGYDPASQYVADYPRTIGFQTRLYEQNVEKGNEWVRKYRVGQQTEQPPLLLESQGVSRKIGHPLPNEADQPRAKSSPAVPRLNPVPHPPGP